MEIKIDGMTLSNDRSDNDNFIDISIEDEDDMFDIDDLLSAILAFKSIRELNNERDKRYEK